MCYLKSPRDLLWQQQETNTGSLGLGFPICKWEGQHISFYGVLVGSFIGLSAFSCHPCFVNSLTKIILLLPSPPPMLCWTQAGLRTCGSELSSPRASWSWVGLTGWWQKLSHGLEQVGCRGKGFGLMEKGQVRLRVGLSRLL